MKILLIDDNRFDRSLVARELGKEFPDVLIKEIVDMSGLSAALLEGDYDLVVTDYQLRWSTGIEVLKTIKEKNPEVPVIMFTGTGNETIAVQAMQAGLDDYVPKSSNHFSLLSVSIKQVLEKERLRRAEKKSAEQISHLNEYRQLILKSVADGIIGIDLDGKHTYANPAALQLLGYTSMEFEGQDSHSLWHHSYQDGANYPLESCPIHTCIDTKKHFSGKDLFWRKDGTSFMAGFTANPVFEGKNCTGAVVVFRDITEKEKIYCQLRKYKRIVSASQEHMAFISRDYTYNAVNGAYLSAQRKKEEEIIGHSISDLFGEEIFRKKFKRKIDECLEGAVVRYQDWFDFPGISEQRCMDIAYYPYKEEDGTVSGLVINSRDITELKKREEALLLADQEWTTTFDSITDFVSVHDSEYRFVKVNKSLAEFLGKKKEELIGKYCYKIMHGLDKCWHECPHAETLLSGKTETQDVIDDNIGCPLSITTSPIYNDQGMIEATVHIARDISEEKKAEARQKILQDQLIQAQKMECVGQLAGGVAHDFNNYLSIIMGCSDLILMGKIIPDKIPHHVKLIRDAADRSTGMVQRLLAFSRKQVIELKSLNLDSLVENISKMLRQLVAENIEFDFNLQVPGLNVMADPNQIEQVLMNLIINAFHAMPNGGRITIETKVKQVELKQQVALQNLPVGPYVVLTVKDTGCGIPTEHQGKIFEPFFTTKKAGKGTGLGLATAYGIVGQHNGRLTFESAEGKGCAFHIFLPVAVSSQAKEESHSDPIVTHGSETVLLVEDDQIVLDVLQQMLRHCGYKVMNAASAERALHYFENNPHGIDIVLTDVILSGMSGPELAQHIEQKSPETPVIFMSGHADSHLVDHGVLKPGINFISKPIILEDLHHKIRKVLDKNKP